MAIIVETNQVGGFVQLDVAGSFSGNTLDKVVEQLRPVQTMAGAELSAVIYCDGGFRNMRSGSFMGWGAHGYIFYQTGKVPEKPAVFEGHFATSKIYTPKSTNVTDIVTPGLFFDMIGSSMNSGSNNQAEICAFRDALTILKKMGVRKLTFQMDSEYLRKSITEWARGWERNGWKRQDGSDVQNQELLRPLYEFYKQCLAEGMEISLCKVKAHSGELGNERADKLATLGINLSEKIELESAPTLFFSVNTPKAYWASDIEKHPFMTLRRVYFNSCPEYNRPGLYTQADNGGHDNLNGKRMPETTFSIIQLSKPIAELEVVRDRQYEFANGRNAIMMLKVDRVFEKEIHQSLSRYGKGALVCSQSNLNLNGLDKAAITVEVDPTGLSMRAIESFNLLEEILVSFQRYREIGFSDSTNSMRVNGHDITALFYDREEVVRKGETSTKFTLKSEINSGVKDMILNIEEDTDAGKKTCKVPLILGADLPPRNNLKKFEELKPRVTLVTWRESSNSFRYAVVIEASGDVGIWSNYFADRIFL